MPATRRRGWAARPSARRRSWRRRSWRRRALREPAAATLARSCASALGRAPARRTAASAPRARRSAAPRSAARRRRRPRNCASTRRAASGGDATAGVVAALETRARRRESVAAFPLVLLAPCGGARRRRSRSPPSRARPAASSHAMSFSCPTAFSDGLLHARKAGPRRSASRVERLQPRRLTARAPTTVRGERCFRTRRGTTGSARRVGERPEAEGACRVAGRRGVEFHQLGAPPSRRHRRRPAAARRSARAAPCLGTRATSGSISVRQRELAGCCATALRCGGDAARRDRRSPPRAPPRSPRTTRLRRRPSGEAARRQVLGSSLTIESLASTSSRSGAPRRVAAVRRAGAARRRLRVDVAEGASGGAPRGLRRTASWRRRGLPTFCVCRHRLIDAGCTTDEYSFCCDGGDAPDSPPTPPSAPPPLAPPWTHIPTWRRHSAPDRARTASAPASPRSSRASPSSTRAGRPVLGSKVEMTSTIAAATAAACERVSEPSRSVFSGLPALVRRARSAVERKIVSCAAP